MSSKAARRSAASSSSQSSTASSMSTPQVPSSSTSSVQSPMTPTRLSRIQEKNVLASLNDRLAAYIERNQVLENENSVMTKQLSQFEENSTRQTTRIKTDYEKEVMSLRKLVDETAKDKSKLDNDIKSLARDFNDVKAKLDKKSKDFTAVQKQLNHVENSLADLQATASKAASERDKYLTEKSDLEGEVARLAREVDDLRKRLEHEALARVEAENVLRHKSDEIAFQHQQYEKEITEVRSRRQVEIQEVDGRLQQEYELKLQLSIQELRAEYEAQLRANKDELDNLYDQKYSDLKAQLKRAQGSSASKSEEIMTLQGRLESSSASTAKFEQELTDLKKRIKEMERKNDEDHSRFAKMLETRDNEIEALVNEKTQLMNDYQDLMDTKVALDNEIATYRKLLEGEEKRLSISPRGDRRGGTPAGGRRGTPLRAVKRRRFDEESIESASEYDTNSVANGDVEILEDDPEGKFIRLHNKGDKDVTLSGWTLTRKTGEIETTHKFHRQMKLEPKGTTTIWSSDVTEAVHEPPTSLVMKGQKWFAGEHVTTTLMNNSGEEMASRETRRMQLSSQKRRLGFGTGATEELFHQAGDAQGDRCVIC